MRGKKTSNEKKAEIITEYLDEPSKKSLRKVGDATGVNKDTVAKTMKEVQTVQTKALSDILEVSLRNAVKSRVITERKMDDGEDISVRDLVSVSADSLRTVQLLRGEATENHKHQHHGKIDINKPIQELEQDLLQ